MGLSVDIKKVLGDFRLDVRFRSGASRIGILGASGCGKSLTLKSIAGIETPDEGTILINDTVVFHSGQKVNVPPQKRKIGYLFQNYALFPTMTVERNIAAGLKGTKREKKERVREMVCRFHLEGLEKRLPGELINYLAGKNVDFVNKSAMNGTILAHTDGNVPNLLINIPAQNEFYLGELFYFFEFACGVSGYISGVNPFNQPGVESYKKNMFALLGKPGFEEEREKLLKRL